LRGEERRGEERREGSEEEKEYTLFHRFRAQQFLKVRSLKVPFSNQTPLQWGC